MKFSIFWKKHHRIEFMVDGKPPRKSSWGEDNDLILKLRQEAFKARTREGLSECFHGPVKLTLTMFSPNVTDIKYKQKGDDDPKKYVGDLDSFVAGVCESLQPAPKNFDRKISKIFDGHEYVGPDVPLIVDDDCQVVQVVARKIPNEKIRYVVKIESTDSEEDKK